MYKEERAKLISSYAYNVTFERVGDMQSNTYKVVDMDYSKLEEHVERHYTTEFDYPYPQLIRTTLKVD